MNLLPDPDGIYVYVNDGTLKLRFLTWEWKFDDTKELHVNQEVDKVTRYKHGFFGTDGQGLYTLIAQDGVLNKGVNLFNAHEIYSIFSTSEYMICQIIDLDGGQRKTVVIRPNKLTIGLYDLFKLEPIKGKVNNVYTWDDFLVFYADKDIILFKAPPSLPPIPTISQPEHKELKHQFQLTPYINSRAGSMDILYSGSTLLNNSAFFAEGRLVTVVPTSMSITNLNLIMFSTSEQTAGFYSYELTVGGLNLDCSIANQNNLLKSEFKMEVNYQLEFNVI
jgi:hypothetical protein